MILSVRTKTLLHSHAHGVGGDGIGIRVLWSRTSTKFSAMRSNGFYDQDARPSLWFPAPTWDVDSDAMQNLHRSYLDREAEDFRHKHDKDVQFVFSRYQHHWHKLDARGTRKPMKYCLVKSRGVQKKGKDKCKAGFPRKVRRDDDGKIIEALCRPRVVCHGVAKELDLKTSGRKNMLGAVAGTRRSSWFAATSALLAKVFRSNTNIQTNYRIPITKKTHDADCAKKKCVRKLSSMKQTRKMLLIAQRAMKQMVGYFGG